MKSEFLITKFNQRKRINQYELSKDDKEVTLESYLKKNHINLSVQESNITKILSLVNRIFPEQDKFGFNTKEHLSVVHPSRFDRYFSYTLLQGDLSEIEFSNARDLDHDKFLTKIAEWTKLGFAVELKNKFYEINTFDSREDFEKIIRAIFYLASQPNENKKRKSKNIVNFDNENLLKKLDNSEDLIVKKYYSEKGGKNQLEIFTKSLSLDAPSPYTFEAKILEDINMSFPRTTYITEELSREFPIDYLNKYCNEISKYDSHIWYLFHRCKYRVYQDTENGSHNRSDETPEKAKEIVRLFVINKDLDGFLADIISNHESDGQTYWIGPLVRQIFDSWKDFENELNKKEESQYKNLEEFNRFYKLYASSNHSQAVVFEFKNITVSN